MRGLRDGPVGVFGERTLSPLWDVQTRKSAKVVGMSLVEGEADENDTIPDIPSQVSCLHDAWKPRLERRYMRRIAPTATWAAETGL